MFCTSCSSRRKTNDDLVDGLSAIAQSEIPQITEARVLQPKCGDNQAETHCAIGSIDENECQVLTNEILPQMPDDALSKAHPVVATEQQALNIVKSHFGDRLSECIDKAEVVRDGSSYVVTIPTKHREVSPGHLRYGSSYLVQAVIDAESGQLIEGRIGR